MVNSNVDKWKVGFDKIDIAPKDGQLSANEICDYRDEQVQYAKRVFYCNPLNWFAPHKIADFNLKTAAYERETAKLRNR